MSRIVLTFIAAAAVTHRQLVKFTANDGEVTPCTAATDIPAGVADFPGGAAIGERVDIVLFGEADVQAGGTVAPGGYVASDASGHAVAAAPSAGVNNGVAGRVLAGAVSGDYIRTFINPIRIQG
jgi:hypothetical protein